MRRVKPRLKLAGRARMTVLALCGSAAACSAFDLGDELPTDDSGVSLDGSSLLDGSVTDGDIVDSAKGPCVDGGDLCNCPAALPVSPAAQGTAGPGRSIIVSGGTVFFLVSAMISGTSTFTVFGAPVGGLGGASPTVVARWNSLLNESVVLGGNWLWFRRTSGAASINRVSIDSTDAQTPAVYFPVPDAPGPMATNSKSLFFDGDMGAICSIPFDGAVAMGDSGASGCGTQPIVQPRDGGPPTPDIVASELNVFLNYNNHIFAAPQSGGVPAEIVPGANGTTIINVYENGGSIFWAQVTGDASTIMSATEDGNAATAIVSSPFGGALKAANIVADASGIYWTGQGDQQIHSAGRDGSNPHPLACEPAGIAAITTDTDYVYWLTNGGAVFRAPK